MSHERRYLEDLLASKQLSAPGFADALHTLGITMDAKQWSRFVDLLLLVGGALLTLAGIVCFFAFNWASMPPIAKLGLAQGLWLAATAAAAWIGWKRQSGRWMLFAAATLIGVLFAVIGQVYQTGADAWQLFALWAMLMLPWVILAGFEPLWALCLLVTLIGIMCWQHLHDSFLFMDHFNPLLSGTLLVALIGWEISGGGRWRIAPRAIGTVLAALVGPPAWFALASTSGAGLDIAIFVLWFVASLVVYLYRRDLMLVALPLFSGMVAILCMFTRGSSDIFATFFLLAILAIGMTIGIAMLLRYLNNQWASTVEEAHHE